MRRFPMRLTAAGGGVVALAVAGWLLSSATPAAGAAPRPRPTSVAHASPSTRGSTGPTGALRGPAVTAPRDDDRTAPPAPPALPLARRVRDLVHRMAALQDGTGSLPRDLRDEFLSLLGEGDAARDLLFATAWEPDVPGMVRARIQMALHAVGDSALRTALLESWKGADPRTAAAAEMAARSTDTADLAAWIDGPATAEEKARGVWAIPANRLSDPVVAAALLRAARRETSRDVRSALYHRLARGAVAEAVPFLVEASGDAGRDLRDRMDAAYALSLHPGAAGLESLLSLYDRSPAEVRVFLLARFAGLPSDARVEDALLAALEDDSSDGKLRSAATTPLHSRLLRMSEAAALDLGHRTAAVLRRLPGAAAGEVLDALGDAVTKNPPLREVAQELYRASGEGSHLRDAVASSRILRRVVGL